jgi:iron(III) transport system substrate-binding protein
MAKRNTRLRRILFVFLALSIPFFYTPGHSAETKLTRDAIVEGAKKEGKVSWASNLVEEEVAQLNKAFQKEFPFMKQVEYARMRGPEENEKLLSEMQAGIFPFDMVHVSEDLTSRYEKLGFLVSPVDWNGLFGVDSRMIHPKRFAVAVGNSLLGVMYNKTKVPKEHIPKAWNDCTNPFFKDRMATEVRPSPHFTELWADKGEEWTLNYAKKIAANKPKWSSSGTAALTMVAAGEVMLFCPTSYGTWYRQASRKPNFPVGWVFPEGPILGSRGLMLSPMKGAQNPHASMLLVGWIASKGLPILDTGRESVFHPETKLGAEFKRTGREIKVMKWEDIVHSDAISKKVLEAWGFPKAEK